MLLLPRDTELRRRHTRPPPCLNPAVLRLRHNPRVLVEDLKPRLGTPGGRRQSCATRHLRPCRPAESRSRPPPRQRRARPSRCRSPRQPRTKSPRIARSSAPHLIHSAQAPIHSAPAAHWADRWCEYQTVCQGREDANSPLAAMFDGKCLSTRDRCPDRGSSVATAGDRPRWPYAAGVQSQPSRREWMKPQATMQARMAATTTKPYCHSLGGSRCAKFMP